MDGMRGKAKAWKAAAAGGFLCVAVAACSMLPGQGTPKKENAGREKETALTVTYASGDEGWNRAVSMAGEAFSKQYPDIHLELRPSTKTQGGFYDDFLRKAVATGDLGDIVELKNTKESVVTQTFTPLPEELTKLVKDKWTMPDGSVYTLPFFRLEQGMIYNKAAFEKAGVSAHETWQEFEALCERLKEEQYTPLVIGAGDVWPLSFWGRYFFNSCVTVHNPSWQQDCTRGNVQWTDKEPEEMMERFEGLFDKGYVDENYASTGDAGTCEHIADGRAVMLYALCNQIPKIQALNPDMELGWFFMQDEEGRRYSFNDNKSGWAITAECKADQAKYDAAVAFLEFFYSWELYQEVCSIMNALPATKEEIRFEEGLLGEIGEQAGADIFRPDIQIGDEETPEGFESIFYGKLTELLAGRTDIARLLEELQTEWEGRRKP